MDVVKPELAAAFKASGDMGLKAGMLVTSVFPIIGTVIIIIAIKYFKRQKK